MNIFAVIVSFNPNEQNLYALMSSLLAQHVTVILVDNASDNAAELANFGHIKLIRLEKNMGIAYAQNTGIKYAIQMAASHIVFFDQDSSISQDFIENIASDYDNIYHHLDKNIAAIGPRLFDEKYNFFYEAALVDQYGFRTYMNVSQITQPQKVSIIISSGMFVEVSILQKIGFMHENYFIDYVDIEWCFRAESTGHHCYVSDKVIMKHRIGDYNIKVFGRSIMVHSAFRRYFRIRNSIYMLREPHVPKLFSLKEVVGGVLRQIMIILYIKENRFAQIKSLFNGLLHGIKNKHL